MLKFNPDFAEAVRSNHLAFPAIVTSLPEGGYLLHQLWLFFSLSSAFRKLPEQHESPGHLPLHPQSLTLFWPPHLIWKRGKEQRGWGLRPKSPLRCSQPGKPALSLRPLVSTRTGGVRGDGLECLYKPCELFSLFLSFSQQADLALQEAIRIAQESNDHVCLQHCLVNTFFYSLLVHVMSLLYRDWWVIMSLHQSWLYTLEQMRGSDSTVLTEDSVKMAAHFCLPVSARQVCLIWSGCGFFFLLLLNCFCSLFTVVSVCKTLTTKCCYPYFGLKISKNKFLRENSHC